MEYCKACGKCVYEMEKLSINQEVYHKTCFKCNHCKRPLSFNIYATMNGILYCKPHFMEIFKSKGKYENNIDALNVVLSSKDDFNGDEMDLPNINDAKRIFEKGSEIADRSIPDIVQTVKFEKLNLHKIEQESSYNCSGIFENSPNIIENIAKESLADTIEELPQDGTTKSLLAKWKDFENIGDGNIISLLPGNKHAGGNIARCNSRGPCDIKDMIVEGDVNDHKPPTDITKNLRVLFQNNQVEKPDINNQSTEKKQYKWAVKEMKPINYPGLLANVSRSPNEPSP